MATVTGAKRHLIIESDTLNTGQGANELYSMDQDVTTTSNVTFAEISATSINVTSITSSIVTSSILKTEGSNIFGDASNDTHTFNGNITVTGTVDGRDIATDGTKLDGIASSANNYSLPLASSTRGGVKIGYTENGKNYPVELSSEKMFVNVPWTDTNTTYSVGDGGLTQNNFTDALKSKLDGIAASANNYSLPIAASGTRGGVKIGYSENGKNYPVELSSEKMYVNVPWTDTNTTYSVGDGGLTQNNFTDALKSKLDGIASSANNYSLPAGSSSTRGGFKIGYSENGKNYPVEVSSEKMYVNVPWTDTNDNTQLSTEQVQDIVGAMFSSNTETRVAATYDDTSGKINIVVDDMTADTDTTYSVGDGGLTQKNFTTTLKTKLDGIATSANNYSLPLAASGTRGGVKIGYSENGKNYPVELSSEKMYVNVPWTDTNTTYSVGDGGLTQNNFTDTLKSKLDGISTSADVTDATTVAAAGALMDSEVTNLAEVKAFDSSDYATAAQGTKADTAHGWGNHASAGYGTSNLALGTTSTTALAGNTTTISTAQANAITANSAKRGISSDEQSAIVANTAKTGITTTQANAITANTAKRDARYIYFPIVANFSGNINSAQFLPLSDGETEGTNSLQRRNQFIAPCAGTLHKILVRSNASLQSEGRGVTMTATLDKYASGDDSRATNASTTVTTGATAVTNTIDFSSVSGNNFTAGTRLLVKLQAPLNATKNYYVTVVFKLDQSDLD